MDNNMPWFASESLATEESTPRPCHSEERSDEESTLIH